MDSNKIRQVDTHRQAFRGGQALAPDVIVKAQRRLIELRRERGLSVGAAEENLHAWRRRYLDPAEGGAA